MVNVGEVMLHTQNNGIGRRDLHKRHTFCL